MLKTFNCGIGAILICSEKDKEKVLNQLQIENPKIIGYVTNYKSKFHLILFYLNFIYNIIYIKNITDKQIRINVKNFEEALELRMKQYIPDIISKLSKPLKKVGVLISGSGTNLQSLIDATRDSSQNIGAEIVIVISNKPNIEGIKRAEKAGIKTVVIFILFKFYLMLFLLFIHIYLSIIYNFNHRLLNILIILVEKLLIQQ